MPRQAREGLKIKMNTQTLLFENSKDIPEGLYINLMDSLKKDFETDGQFDKLRIMFAGYINALQDLKDDYEMENAMKYLTKIADNNIYLMEGLWKRYYVAGFLKFYYLVNENSDRPSDTESEITETIFNTAVSNYDVEGTAFRLIFDNEPSSNFYLRYRQFYTTIEPYNIF